MKISELLEGLAEVPEKADRNIIGLVSDSREIEGGSCFVALKGSQQDGGDYIPTALNKGAVAILTDQTRPYSSLSTVPVISVSDLSQKLPEIALRFFKRPSEKISVIGVTGTNGKTSVSQFIANALQMHRKPCGIIGTLGYGFPGKLIPSTHTTGNVLLLQKQLAELHHQGAETVAMEVSSHAIDQKRIAGIIFKTAIFTNLTRDHLDYHPTMEDYAATKRRLFLVAGLEQAIINTDDEFGLSLAKELQDRLAIYCYGLKKAPLALPSVLAHSLQVNTKGMTAKLSTPWGEGLLHTKMLGRFNMSNLLAVLTTLCLTGVELESSLMYLSALQTLPGRMEMFGGNKLPLVVVDYAHTPDALMQVLQALRDYTSGRLWCVFGCGGERDKGKRSLMGQVAEQYADQLLITDDNPRSECSSDIVADIIQDLLCPWAVEIEHDRATAIAHVIHCAAAGDVILLAGKGHEAYQMIGNEKILFSDAAQVQALLHLKQKNL